MAATVFGDPFGAALSGKRAALQDVLHAGESARQQRESDLNNDFAKWYQPLRMAETQNKTGAELLKEQAQLAHYTGDYRGLNQILQQYYGVRPEALPQGFSEGKATVNQTKAADLATGNFPIAASYPGVIAAGGIYQALPNAAAQGGTGDPEIDQLRRALLIDQYKRALNPPTDAPLPHMSPLGSIPNPSALSSVNPPSTEKQDKTDLNALYGVPKPEPQGDPAAALGMNGSSIWEDEYNGGDDAGS